ncbi:MAG: hypothetical protein RLZZ528_555, partial [Pseudomonadota bacterium]
PLLASVSSENTESILDALRAAGFTPSRIGTVTGGAPFLRVAD